MKHLLLFALLCGAVLAQKISIETAVQCGQQDRACGYSDGWHDAFLDGWTVNEFHRRADDLDDDTDQDALNGIWADLKPDRWMRRGIPIQRRQDESAGRFRSGNVMLVCRAASVVVKKAR